LKFLILTRNTISHAGFAAPCTILIIFAAQPSRASHATRRLASIAMMRFRFRDDASADLSFHQGFAISLFTGF